MRRVLLLLPLAIAGCKREQKFDDRYNDTAAAIQQRAEDLDNQATTMSAAGLAMPAQTSDKTRNSRAPLK